MHEIVFDYSGDSVRAITINGDPYFCASDVGKILDLKNVLRQVRRLPEKGRTAVTTPTAGGNQALIYISEENLYRLIFKSKKKEAILFQDWVFDEVLPSLRKTGKYSIPDNVKKISKESRNVLTDEWKNHGIDKPYQYIQLTLQEYKNLGFKKGKRKNDLTREELLLLNALESMESLKLFKNEEINGYYQCKDSLIDTTNNVKRITNG